MGYMKHVCKDESEVIEFIMAITEEGKVVDRLEVIEFDHFLVTYH